MTIRAHFARDTAVDPSAWRPERPSIGHCAVAALLVQDLIGGEILRVRANTNLGVQSHYWNQFAVGEVDLTIDQFDSFHRIDDPEQSPRSGLLANLDTERRYRLLRSRVLATSTPVHDSKVRYAVSSGTQTQCEDCGAVIANQEAHSRFHSILNGHAWALAVLKTAHLAAHVHEKYEVVDRIDSKRFDSWSADAFAEVVAGLNPADATREDTT